MTKIALYHSVLGVRPGVLAAADAFRSAGHEVLVVDQYDGQVFDDYEKASGFAESMGYPALMQLAVDAVADWTEPFVTAGFSNGGGMSEFVAASRGGTAGGVIGSVQFAGAMPLQMLGLSDWPASTPVQLHYSTDDPFRNEEWVQQFIALVAESGSPIETYLDYPIAGHLFTDASLPEEYDRVSADLAMERALTFVERLGGDR